MPAKQRKPWKQRVWRIVFESDTRAGRLFDVVLLWAILGSLAVVVLDSVPDLRLRFGVWFTAAEWVLTGLFSIEYVLRVWVSPKRKSYVFSVLGLVDLASVLPTYLSAFVPSGHYLLAIRTLRLLRVFRVLKLTRFLAQARMLQTALMRSRDKLVVFLMTVLALVVVIGSLMYLIEGESNGFASIPQSIYWAIVTLTTVGYGDIGPQTGAGRFLASIVMLIGYAIIAVPTGIVTAEIGRASKAVPEEGCRACPVSAEDPDARFCKRCGSPLPGR